MMGRRGKDEGWGAGSGRENEEERKGRGEGLIERQFAKRGEGGFA